jgi:hypothetical protein
MATKKGPSTGGASVSKIKKPKGSQPLTLGSGGLKTNKVSQKQKKETRKVVAVVAATLTPTGKLAKSVASFRSKSVAKKLEPGESITKTRKFQQGKDSITMKYPKRAGGGEVSPIKDTKVKVTYQTRSQSPLQVATTTSGRVARESTKKTGTYLKGAVQGGYVVDRKAQADKKKGKK